jgi:hypothetical protein
MTRFSLSGFAMKSMSSSKATSWRHATTTSSTNSSDPVTTSGRGLYIDRIGTVSLFGPFKGEEKRERVSDPEMVDAVVAYMKRRFDRIDRLGDDGYETIWRRPTTSSTAGKPRRGD